MDKKSRRRTAIVSSMAIAAGLGVGQAVIRDRSEPARPSIPETTSDPSTAQICVDRLVQLDIPVAPSLGEIARAAEVLQAELVETDAELLSVVKVELPATVEAAVAYNVSLFQPVVAVAGTERKIVCATVDAAQRNPDARAAIGPQLRIYPGRANASYFELQAALGATGIELSRPESELIRIINTYGFEVCGVEIVLKPEGSSFTPAVGIGLTGDLSALDRRKTDLVSELNAYYNGDVSVTVGPAQEILGGVVQSDAEQLESCGLSPRPEVADALGL